MRTFLLGCFMLGAAFSASAQNYFMGMVVDESDCASGGPVYYFLSENRVVKEDCGDDCPIVEEGTWEYRDGMAYIEFHTFFYGKGNKLAEGPQSARAVYETYTAKKGGQAYDEFLAFPDVADKGCEAAYELTKYDENTDIHVFLRNDFKGDYPEASERFLTKAELRAFSASELKIMRNEIFARYGYMFKTEKMRNHFENRRGYYGYYEDVSAFLSKIEVANVELIKSIEKEMRDK